MIAPWGNHCCPPFWIGQIGQIIRTLDQHPWNGRISQIVGGHCIIAVPTRLTIRIGLVCWVGLFVDQMRSHDVKIGPALFADSAGGASSPEGTYIGMVRANIRRIAAGLSQ